MSELKQFFGGSMLAPTQLCASPDTFSTIGTVTVGTIAADAVAWTTPAAINAGLGTSWTDFIDVSGEDFYEVTFKGSTAVGGFLYLQTDSGETAGNALQCQVLVDGAVIFDGTTTQNAGGDRSIIGYAGISDYDREISHPFIAPNSFKVRAKRTGTFVHSSSRFLLGGIIYNVLEAV